MPQRLQCRTREPRRLHTIELAQHAGPEIPALHTLPRPHPRVEQRPHLPAMTLRIALLLIPTLTFAPAFAQDTVAPTTGESTAPARGENVGAYNVVQSWELGYRYATIGGDSDKYRSDVNYHDGVRLLSSYLDRKSTRLNSSHLGISYAVF